MTLTKTSGQTYNAVIETVRADTAKQRLTRVQDVLATIALDVASGEQRQPTLPQALGLLAIADTVPSDEKIGLMLDERRRERYGL